MQEKHISVVFVVDDEVVISKSLAMILECHGYVARFFTDPLEVLKHLDVDPPDLLISDVAMPQLSGIDLAIHVRAHVSDCKILLYSGHAAMDRLLDQAQAQGHCFTLLPKPIHPVELLRSGNAGCGP